jgi:hypothetical protein
MSNRASLPDHSDPTRNPQFRRRWSEPPIDQRRLAELRAEQAYRNSTAWLLGTRSSADPLAGAQ